MKYPIGLSIILNALAAISILSGCSDYLELGAGHRTNEPGTQSGNWQWRMLPGELTPELAQRIRKLTRIYGRLA